MKKTKAHGENNALSAVKHGGILVVLWSCFVSSDSGNMQRLKGKMNSIKSSRKCRSGGKKAKTSVWLKIQTMTQSTKSI